MGIELLSWYKLNIHWLVASLPGLCPLLAVRINRKLSEVGQGPGNMAAVADNHPMLLKCAQVLVGDNATRLAVRLLGNIAQGRGGTLPFDTVC